MIFSDLDEIYEPLKNERARARESNYSENSENNMRSFQKTRFCRQRRGRRFINFSDEGKVFRLFSLNKLVIPFIRVMLPSFGKKLDFNGNDNKEKRDLEN
jgi:hypothetical protein